MNAGFYSPTFRMAVSQVSKMEAIAENLANSATPGYRRLQVDHKVFETMLNKATFQSPRWEEAQRFDPISVDFSQGALKATDRPLDFAISGDAFFVVSHAGRDYYTRNGHFNVNKSGQLLNSDGYAVEGINGPITIPTNTNMSQLTVDTATGAIHDGLKVIGTLKLTSFKDNSRLIRSGTTLYSAPPDLKPQPPNKDVRVVNGTLEASNTSVFTELTETITCLRNYETCQRMIKAHDENQGKMIQQLG